MAAAACLHATARAIDYLQDRRRIRRAGTCEVVDVYKRTGAEQLRVVSGSLRGSMQATTPRCAYLPCPGQVVATLQHGEDTYHLCFDHLCVAAQEGLVNEQRALRAEARYADLLRDPSELGRKLQELRTLTREAPPLYRARPRCRGSAPSRARRASPLPA